MAGFEKIGALAAKMERLTSPDWRLTVAKQLAGESRKLIDDGFAKQRDPYGNPWASTKKGGPILQETGALRSRWRLSRLGPDGFLLEDSQDYGMYQQYGTAHIVPRMMVPEEDKELGPIWGPALEKIAARAFKEVLK